MRFRTVNLLINETVGAYIVIGSIFWDGKSPHICSALFYIFLRNTLVLPTDFSAETPARPAHRMVGHLGTTFVGRLWRVMSGGRCLHHPALYLVWRLEKEKYCNFSSFNPFSSSWDFFVARNEANDFVKEDTNYLRDVKRWHYYC